MINILLSLVVGAVVFAILYLPGLLDLGESIVPGVLATFVAYYVFARRSFKRVEGIFTAAAKHLQSMTPNFDLAVQTLQRAYPFARWQIGVKSQVDSQIGVIYFLQQDFKSAAPYLERSLGFGHWMGGAMLAVIHYKRKNFDRMKEILGVVTKRGKGQSLAWNLRAYLLQQIGDREGAQQVLIEGLKKTKDDPKVKDALLALQNGKKIKMRVYKEQWYQFHLERPPAQYAQPQVPMRISKAARRGRW